MTNYIKETYKKRTSVGTRIFLVLMGLAISLMVIFMIAFLAFSMRFNAGTRRVVEEVESSAMDEMVLPMLEDEQASVQNYARGQAKTIDRFFRGCQKNAEMLATVGERSYAEGIPSSRGIIQLPEKGKLDEVSPYCLYADGFDPNDPENVKEMEVMSRLGAVLRAVHGVNEEIDAAYFASVRGYTYFSSGLVDNLWNEDGSVRTYNAAEREWYKGAVEKHGVYYSHVMNDYFTGEELFTCSIPLYNNDQLIGVVAIDVNMNTLTEIVGDPLNEGGGVVLVTDDDSIQLSTVKIQPVADLLKDHKSIDDPELSDVKAAMEDARGQYGVGMILYDQEGEVIPEIEADDMSDDELQEYIERSVDAIDCSFFYAPIEQTQWSYYYVVRMQEASNNAKAASEKMVEKSEAALMRSTRGVIKEVVIFFGCVLLLGVVMNFVAKRVAGQVSEPIMKLTDCVKAISGDNLSFEWDDDTYVETQVLGEAFNGLTERITNYIDEITTVTAEKERIGAELDVATRIQLDMLPDDFPEDERFAIFASAKPAKEVGGDFYDFFMVDDDRIAMVIADVSGKGVPAALFMVIAKTLIKNETVLGRSPKEILANVNERLIESNKEMLFVTVWIGILTLSTGKMVCANGGHEYPILRRAKDGADAKFELFMDEHDIPLAAIEGVGFGEYELQLEPGDYLYLYTDGFPESTNVADEQFTEDRMLDALNETNETTLEGIDTYVRNKVKDFVGGTQQFDDMTSLVFYYHRRG